MKLLVTYHQESKSINSVQQKPNTGMLLSGLEIITGTKEFIITTLNDQGFNTQKIENFEV